MLRVPEHYAHFGAHSGNTGWIAAIPGVSPVEQAAGATWLRKVRKALLWAVLAPPALVLMAVWQFVDPSEPTRGQEQRD